MQARRRSKVDDMKTRKRRQVTHAIEGAAAGAAAGAVVGAIAGPAGAAVGAVLGGAAGAAAEALVERDARTARSRDQKLDEEIGVTSGDLGAPTLKHPPASIGAFSAGASGAAGAQHTLAEGPLSRPGEDDD